VKNRAEVEVLQTVLDEGEAEVITLGQEIKADLLILDNREPRNKVGFEKCFGTACRPLFSFSLSHFRGKLK
jgi:hypothetical protein